MKILIGYDGSEHADAALADLKRAGLPHNAEVVVLSVAEELMPAPASMGGVDTTFAAEDFKGEQDALRLAQSANATLEALFPDWQISAEAATGAPASSLIWKAEQWQPELLVVGSQGRTALGRFFLGSVSQSVLHHAPCAVRVARGNAEKVAGPARLIVGLDGSSGAAAAVKALTARAWPPGSQARIVIASGRTAFPVAPSIPHHEHVAMQMAEWLAAEKQQLAEAAESAARDLSSVGLIASTVIRDEDPKRLLLDEAEQWEADCIFVGAKGRGRIERLLLGSVSAAVAARAHCSVEVVRPTAPRALT